MRRTPRAAAVFIGLLLVAGAASGLVAQRWTPGPRHVDPIVLVPLGVLLVVAETLMVRYRVGDEVNALNLFDAVLAPLLLAGPAVVVLVIVALAQAVAATIRRNRGMKALFNIAQWTLAAGCARLVLSAAGTGIRMDGRGVALLPLAMLVAGIVNQLAFTIVVALAERQKLRQVLRGFAPVIRHGWLGGWAVNTSFGVVFAVVAGSSRAAVPLLAIPLFVLHSAYRGQAEALAGRARDKGVHRAVRALDSTIDARDAIPRFLREVVNLFRAQAAELILEDADGAERFRLTAAGGSLHERSFTLSPLALRVEHIGAAVAIGAGTDHHLDELVTGEGWREALAAPFAAGDMLTGVLFVFDRGGLEGDTQSHLAALEVLAREVSTTMAKAELVRGIVEEQRKLAEIVTHASDGILTLTSEGVVASWNPELERITGYRADEMIGRRSLARLAARDHTGAGVAFDDWAVGPSRLPGEIHIATREGERRQLACSYSPVPAPNGQPHLLIVVARDATQANAMRQLQEDYRRLTELEAAQREVVDQLQEAVRPPMPLVPGTELGVHYLPADEIAPTGGDLYDWQLLPDGDLHLAVVDVLGKGVAATKDAMTVTSALRLLALEGCPLETFMTRANSLVTAQSPELVATTMVVRYTPSTGRVRVAGAGHPPALVVSANGVHEIAAPGIALGWPGAGSFSVSEWHLKRDDTLILYTDGLVEATKDVLAGTAALMATAAASAEYPAGKLARVLVERSLAGAERRDDSVALVLRRRCGMIPGADPAFEMFERRFTPAPASVTEARRELGAWLRIAGLSGEMYDDVLLVTSELVTNAVRVADAEVALRARLDADGVTIEVEDDGTGGLRWPRPQHLRHDLYSETGRGLVIVEELSGEVAVFSDDDGTVVRCARHAAGLSTPIDRLIRVVSERLTVSTEAAPERAPRGIFDPPSN